MIPIHLIIAIVVLLIIARLAIYIICPGICRECNNLKCSNRSYGWLSCQHFKKK